MNDPTLIFYLPLVALLIWAAATDVARRRIPNWLTVTLVASGIGLSFTGFGLVSPGQAGLGLLIGLFVPFVLFALGGLGAGDVKLLAGIGAWVGGSAMVYVLLAAGITGGVLVIAMSLWQGRLRVVLRNTGLLVLNLVWIRQLGMANVQEMGRQTGGLRQTVPYAVPIVLGTIAVLLSDGLRS